MTPLLEQAFARASQLSSEEQGTIASLILREIEANQRWEDAFARSQDALSRFADEALAEHRAGRTKYLNVDDL